MKKTIITILTALVAFSASMSAVEMTSSPATVSAKPKVEIKEVTFDAVLHCANCVKKVQENIAFEKGVKDLKVSLKDQTIYVKYDASKTSVEILKAAIEKLGVSAHVHGEQCSGHQHKH